MPAKITMSLSNNHYQAAQMAALVRAQQAAAPRQKQPQPSRLNSSMVERIHAIKPGCGSCGK
jgi:hypothetical protein